MINTRIFPLILLLVVATITGCTDPATEVPDADFLEREAEQLQQLDKEMQMLTEDTPED